jgi:hypothetical protein
LYPALKKRKSSILEEKKKEINDDDSISEITDLEKEEILTKYYSGKLSSL